MRVSVEKGPGEAEVGEFDDEHIRQILELGGGSWALFSHVS